MKILFIDNFSINFGVSYLSAVLKKAGHAVDLMYFPFSKWKGTDIYRDPARYFDFEDIAYKALAWNPDVIGFSVFSPNFMFFKNAVEAISGKSSVPLLAGGVLPTLAPELIMDDTCCNYVLRGEAEPVILDVLENIMQGTPDKVPNLCYRGSDGVPVYKNVEKHVENLDDLPFCDIELYPNSPNAMFVLSSRGCSMQCTYCSAGKYSRMVKHSGMKIVRKRKVDSVIEEISRNLKKVSYKSVYFYDDFFITTKEWLQEFAEKYKNKIAIPYYCTVFPSMITEEIACLLSESGCKSVQIGFQTASDDYKINVLKRRDTKDKVKAVLQILDRHNVHYFLDHIFNFPGEKKEQIKESLDFYIDVRIKGLSIFFLNYHPDTLITKWAHDNNYLNDQQYEDIIHNRVIGEMSYKGTIIDERKSVETVQYAVLFRLISWLPGSCVKWMFKKNLHKWFPTNRILYYLLSALTELKDKGLEYILVILFLSFNSGKLKHKG